MSDWPELRIERDHPTLAILHLASQMMGKIRVAHAPWSNHGWHVALQPRANGFETLPTAAADGRTFTLALDLCTHAIELSVSDDGRDSVPLAQPTIADLHAAFVAMLDRHGLPSSFNAMPSEIDGAAPFADDRAERAYDPDSADRLRRAFARLLPVFDHFRAGFAGKSSPVHLWWGAFDLAVSRFSGKTAPPHPGGMPGLPDRVAREAYSHEVASAGFWAAGAAEAEPFFYSYIYPEPDGYRSAKVAHGRFDETFGEFLLPYAEVRAAADPAAMLGEFLQSAYEAAATSASWDRAALERAPVAP
ncbi:hypothetical protein H8M03_08795 [Sphingomonas sabuli]|uniref:Ava_C0101 and related proteins n=1 Tax=Sphingomonas sabuli TaxID=2764186 RepID=A0A7G9L0H4_9SPHN|nr:DUF5996 family protein [Sphingomonas sabuli]QNM82123.1 hypothetical protein H8M03_08795 [Sphingomonas sabuli]